MKKVFLSVLITYLPFLGLWYAPGPETLFTLPAETRFAPSLAAGSLEEVLNRANQDWLNSYNQSGDVGKHYLKNAVFFPETGNFLRGSDAIAGYYRTHAADFSKLTACQTAKRFTEAAHLVYETGLLTNDQGQQFHYLVIWNGSSGTWQRELEMIARQTADAAETTPIDQARAGWMAHCNAKDHRKLVETLYTADAYYYNRGRVQKGWSELTQEYTYMAQPAYQLKLNPLYVVRVQPGLAYDVGRCAGSYNGHYILRWEKQPCGEWRASLDANY